jgi:acyl-CoA hydrolase
MPQLNAAPKRASESATEMVQVVLPNDANPLGFILGGTVMHLIDIAGAIACHRHTRSLVVTAAVDGLQFLHPIKVGDLIILKARVTAAWTTSLEVEVEVFSEETLTGLRRMTSIAYLTFVAIDRDGRRVPIPPLILETPADKQRAAEADDRRAQRLKARAALEAQAH